MTRARQRIAKALAAKGYRPVVMDWSPLGVMIEMQGPEGGWVVEAEPVDPDDPRPYEFFPGMNVDEVLTQIGYIEERV